jgi:hypothetical protein
MTVWTKIKALVDRVLGDDERAANLREEELRLAAAALLVRLADRWPCRSWETKKLNNAAVALRHRRRGCAKP